MKKVLEMWLKDHIGIFLDFDDLDHALKDGMLFIRILKYYDAINVSSIKNVFPSDDLSVCRNNLLQLKVWFKLLDIDFSDDIINKIIEGDSSLCIYILYQLFLVFKKGDLHLVKKQTERSVIGHSNERFKVSKTNVSKIKSTKVDKRCSSFGTINETLNNKEIIEWYKEKHHSRKVIRSCNKPELSSQNATSKVQARKNVLEQTYQKSAQSKSRQLKRNFKEDVAYVRGIDKKCTKHVQLVHSRSDSSDDRFSKGDRVITTRFPSIENHFYCSTLPPISCKPAFESALPSHVQDYMKRLKSSTGFSCRLKKENSYVTKILKDVWDNIVEREKLDITNMIASKLVKQSSFERDMVSTFMCILTQNKAHKYCFLDLENRLESARQSGNISTTKNVDNDQSVDQDNDDSDNDDTNQSSYFNSIKQRYIYDNYNAYCLSEKRRTVELHRKLYAEKLKLRFERHYAICLHTLEAIVDLAIKQSEYVNYYGLPVPNYTWLEWKCLFFCEQPIFDVVTEISQKLFPDDPNDSCVEIERSRQEVLNECDLDMYLNLTDTWDCIGNDENQLNESSIENLKYTIIHESQILLGYIVHRILERKYPLPPQPKPASIPKYPIMTVVNQIDNVEAVNNFRKLLSTVDILVIDVNTAVNFCLECIKDIDNLYFSECQDAESFIVSSESSLGITLIDKSESQIKTEFTQTTNSLFENETDCLEEAATLGVTALKMMLLGTEIPSTILIEIIIQYIKCHTDGIKGWVLVNFPSTLYQASEFEYALSGRKFPFRLEDDIGLSSSSECRISTVGRDMFSETSRTETRTEYSSNIVPNPRTYTDVDTFKTYFSMYISAIKGTSNEKKGTDSDIFKKHSESTLLLEEPEKEGIPSLYDFYQDQGIVYDFIYEGFDLGTLNQLARFILMYYFEDAKIQRFPEDLFSERLLLEFEPRVGTISCDSQYSFSESGMLKSTQHNTFVNDIDEESIINENSNECSSSVYNKQEITWNIVDLPIPDNAAIALANFWEVIESEYLNTLKEVFFLRRNADNELVPYITFIDKQMKLYLNNEDDRQKIVTDFLEAYNSIHQILRSDNEMINELHLRVIELKQELITLCEEKRDRIEQLRRSLINQNWIYQELGIYTNFCLQLLQIEINRCIKTLNFAQDYYLTMLENYRHSPLPEVTLPKIELYMGDEIQTNSEELLEDDIDVEKETITYVNPNPQEVNDPLYSQITEMLYNNTQDCDVSSLFYNLLEQKTAAAFNEVFQKKSYLNGMINSEEAAALKKYKDLENKPPEKKKKDKLTAASTESQVSENKTSDMENLIKKLFEEWKSVVNNEFDRFSFRLNLIKEKFMSELKIIEKSITTKLVEFSSDAREIGLRELSCIDDICYLFQIAIEERTPISGHIVFDKDNFYIILYPEKPHPPHVKLPVALEELVLADNFTINQLEEMKKQLMVIAPKGHITQEALIKYIQSIIAYIYSRECSKLVPTIWFQLEKQDLSKLFQKLFGHYSIVEWRDFLIYCLDLPFPLTEDIVDARLQFLQYDSLETERVSYDDFMRTTLWFERELPESPSHALRNVLAKEFVFSLFKTSDDKINYMAMLMSFCRDEDPKIGFGKALSLYLGKCVIVYEEDLYLEQILTDLIDTEVKVVKEILDEILDDVVSNAMSTNQQAIPNMPNIESSLHAFTKYDSFIDSIDRAGVVLTKAMYHEIFRKHSVLNWTSKVPSVIVVSLISVAFYTMLLPDHVYLQPNIFKAIQDHLRIYGDDDVYIPEFLNSWWLEITFLRVRKFCAFSVTNIIREILMERNE